MLIYILGLITDRMKLYEQALWLPASLWRKEIYE